jgi:hypothetical protein
MPGASGCEANDGLIRSLQRVWCEPLLTDSNHVATSISGEVAERPRQEAGMAKAFCS